MKLFVVDPPDEWQTEGFGLAWRTRKNTKIGIRKPLHLIFVLWRYLRRVPTWCGVCDDGRRVEHHETAQECFDRAGEPHKVRWQKGTLR